MSYNLGPVNVGPVALVFDQPAEPIFVWQGKPRTAEDLAAIEELGLAHEVVKVDPSSPAYPNLVLEQIEARS